jgi:acyl-CoA thioesterase I
MVRANNAAVSMATLRCNSLAAKMGLSAVLFNCVLALSMPLVIAGPGQRMLRIVAFGDSLTAGFELAPADAFPAQLERALKAKGYAVEVINAGVSGDTTAAALERLSWAIPEGSDAVIVELGANDALRGLNPGNAEANLDLLITALKKAGMEVMLAGMKAPRNFGASYAIAFDAIFPDLAAKHGLILYPFFLDGIAFKSDLSLSDGVHPNAEGVGVIVKNILPSVETLIARVMAKQAWGKG